MSEQERIDALRKLIEEQHATLKSGLRVRRWVTGGLVVFVLIYLSVITISVASTFTPENLADVALGAMAENAPQIRGKMVRAADESIPGVVDHGIQQLYDLMPMFRQAFLEQLENIIPEMPPEFYDRLARDIEVYFQEHKQVVDSLVAGIDSPEERRQVMEAISAKLQTDIRMFMHSVSEETDSLKAELDLLINKPDRELTAEQRKTKEVLIYFLYLLKNRDAA